MKRFLTVCLALCLLLPALGAAEDGAENILGQWQMTCTVSETYFAEAVWEQYLLFEEGGKVSFVQGDVTTDGTWTMNGKTVLTSMEGELERLYLTDNGLLMCGSYMEGSYFSRDGKMPSYERVEGGVSENGFYYEQMADGMMMITGHTSREETPVFDENGVMTNAVDLVLPESIRGIPVRAVGMSAFYGNVCLRSAVLPEGIVHLGREAFNDCVSLERVVLPETLTTIGGYAFSHCSCLQPVHIPSQVREISFNPFTDCYAMQTFDLAEDNLWYRLENDALVEVETNHLIAFPAGTEKTEFTVPDHITSLRLAAFMGCENLEKVTVPEGVREMESFVFENTGLKKVNVPASLVVMEDNPFGNCRNLEQVDVAPGNALFSSVDGVLFDAEKSRLIYYPMNKPGSTYTVPEGIRVIGADAFTRNRRLTEVFLPSSLKTIENYAFYKMRSLSGMTVPEGVEEIGSYTFCECGELRRVSVPDTVQKIGYCTFGFCEDLEVILSRDTEIHEFAFEEAQRITLSYR